MPRKGSSPDRAISCGKNGSTVEYGGIAVGEDRYKVELVMYDDGSDAGTAADLVEKLIDED